MFVSPIAAGDRRVETIRLCRKKDRHVGGITAVSG